MVGDKIFARALTQRRYQDGFGNIWQYHSQSDYHSKVACWAILFDLLQECDLLRKHIVAGKVGFGINHKMTVYGSGLKKDLDLVLCTPGGDFKKNTFSELVKKYNINLDANELGILEKLPTLRKCPVKSTLLAIEAKACMTEHSKAIPRLYAELDSSYRIIIGDTNTAISAGYITINISDTFISTSQNKRVDAHLSPVVNPHDQPDVSKKVYDMIWEKLARRSSPDQSGYDAIGITLLVCKNDGSVITVADDFGDGSSVDPIMRYSNFIGRLSTIYSTRFIGL